jgi:hypothetical protein
MKLVDIADGRSIRIIYSRPWTNWAKNKLRHLNQNKVPISFLHEWNSKMAACVLLDSLDEDFQPILSLNSFYEPKPMEERYLDYIKEFQPKLQRFIDSRKSRKFRLIKGRDF